MASISSCNVLHWAADLWTGIRHISVAPDVVCGRWTCLVQDQATARGSRTTLSIRRSISGAPTSACPRAGPFEASTIT